MNQLKEYILQQVANKELSIDKAKELLKELKFIDPESGTALEDIAIIGMAGRFPKAFDLEEYWNNIIKGINCIDRPSLSRRKDWENVLKSYFKMDELPEESLSLGGYLDDINAFDADFFDISSKEAKFMDPWQRNMLEVAYLALEDAGYGGQSAYGSDTGVFIGRDHAVESSYAKIVGNIHPLVLTGSYASILASRISHTFNFQGPSIVIDTACSSALVAIHQACLALKSGQCSVAIAGGINLRENFLESPDQPMNGILTEESKVRTFDKSAKGTLLSEGVGAILLKPYKQAVKDGDRIYALVKGSAINNDGGKRGIATPNAKMQQKVIEQTWECAGINPESISYIEAHGTGTLLGDPIEVKAITDAFKKYTNRKQFCAISTAKTNIGHTVAASGLASLVKAVFSLKHKKIPRVINFKEVNPYIDFADSAVYVNDHTAEWSDSTGPRRCGINSFGFSGTNCHIVLEEALNVVQPAVEEYISKDTFPYLFSISAKNDTTLRELIKNYKYFLEDMDWGKLNIANMCYTTLCGRGHYKFRIQLLVNNIEDLYHKINILHESDDWNKLNEGNIKYGWHRLIKNYETSKQVEELTDKDLKELNEMAANKLKLLLDGGENWHELSELYVKGAIIDWQSLYQYNKPQRVELPLYPLERKSVWIDGSEKKIKSVRERRRERQERSKRSKKDQENNNEIVSTLTSEENIMISIWKEVLNVEKIGLHDNFFGLGGDSIKVIQVASKAQDQGIKMSVEQLFENPTVYELVPVVINERKEEKPVLINNFELLSEEDRLNISSDMEDAYPISALQTGMLFHSIWASSSESFHDILSLHIRENLDKDSFKKAVNMVVRKHPVLRTTFDFVNFSKPIQIVHFQANAPIQTEDITSLSSKDQESYLKEWRLAQKNQGFDWTKPPLIRIYIHHRSDTTFQLSLSFHHAILDGWSVSSLLTELFMYYSKLKAGQSITLESSGIGMGFRDYIAAENKMIESSDAPLYWKEKLKDLETTDILRKRITDNKREQKVLEEVRLTVKDQLVDSLIELSRKISVPLKTIFLAAHIKTLQLTSGKQDVLSGIVVNGRLEYAGGDRVLGLFLNTLPFRFNTSYTTWEELIKETFLNEQELIAVRRFPFAEIQKTTNKPIVLSSIFNYQNFHIYNEVNKYGQLEVLSDEMFEVTDVPLYVRFIQGRFNNEITLGLQYDSNLFSKPEIDRLGNYYLNILNSIANNPNQFSENSNLILINEKEKIEHLNNTKKMSSQNSLIELIESQVLSSPDRIALSYREDHLSFKEMYQQVEHMARSLKKIGLVPGSPVGVYMNRSFESIISLLAIWKAGCIYVPLDPKLPSQRIEYMLKDAKLDLILTHGETNMQLPQAEVKIWNVDTVPNIRFSNKHSLESRSNLEDVAYIIYTSGSTGVPKGVMGKHSGLLNRCRWMWMTYPFNKDELCCFKTSISFIDSLGEILTPLTQGIPLLILPDESVMNPSSFIEEMSKHKVTRLVLVPSLLALLLDLYNDLSHRLPDLKFCISSGEELTTSIVQEWKRKMPGRKLLNLYGSSEVSADVLYHEVDTNINGNKTIPLGRPIHNTKVYILNSMLEQVPLGVIGEIYIGGEGLAKGYLNHDRWTSERFVSISNSDIDEILYKTGDLGYYNNEGEIVFKGRSDNQIQLNGFRIELQEIEAKLRTHQSVKEAVVKVSKDNTGNMVLVAYIIGTSPDDHPSSMELKNFLLEYLPTYMIPKIFNHLEFLPKLPNGKIDRNSLPEFIKPTKLENLKSTNKMTSHENFLSETWAGTIGQPPKSVHEDFFSAGGNSLKAMRFIFLVQREYQITVPIKEFYRKPTIYAVGKLLEHMTQTTQLSTKTDTFLVDNSKNVEESDFYPLTSAQEKLWTYQQLNLDSSAYVLKMKMDIRGMLDIDGLNWCFNELLKKHSTLRTKVIFNGETPLQTVLNFSAYNIDFHDVCTDKTFDEKSFIQTLEREVQLNDNGQKYMFHIQGIKYSEERYQLIFMINHLLFDFWSIGILVKELSEYYENWISRKNLAQEAIEPENKGVKFRDFVKWEQDLKKSNEKLIYWKDVLSLPLPILRLPTDRPRRENVLYTAKRTGMLIPPKLTDNIKQFSQEQNTTPFVTLLSAFKALLFKYTAKSDMIIGVPVSNRLIEEFESLIGCCIDTLAIRTKFEDHASFQEILLTSKDTFINAYINNRLPFEHIINNVLSSKGGKGNNIFQYMFNYMSEQGWEVNLPGDLNVSTTMIPPPHPKFELSFEVLDTLDGMILEVEYAQELYEEPTVTQIIQDFLYLLKEVLINPNKSILNVDLKHDDYSDLSLDTEITFDI